MYVNKFLLCNYVVVTYWRQLATISVKTTNNICNVKSHFRDTRTGTAGMALARPIFQGFSKRAPSKILILYVHMIIMLSALCDPNGARNGIIGIYQWLLALVLLMVMLWWSQKINFTLPRHFYFWSACLDQLQTLFVQVRSSGVRNVVGYNLLHMMFCTNAAFCYIWKAKWEQYKAFTKHEPAFISKGFTNCMKRC